MSVNDEYAKKEPLAFRMAPRSLSEYIGQEHILGEGKMLRRMIEADRLSSIILFGPPGTGKTALARLIAHTTSAKFERINAVTAGVSDIKRIVEDAKNPIMTPNGKVVLFVDEIHRFNKMQQDALLPHVEDGTVVLIGATTENPFFEVNKALISRSTVLSLKPLTDENIIEILKIALQDKERGLGNEDISISERTLAYIADLCNGDARIALRSLELAYITTPPNAEGTIVIDEDVMQDCMQKRSLAFDTDGESHYDNISAMIKSMRGSDPDAAIFYLARALHSGEDIEFLARRILICASEDVGMANPNAILVANAAYQGIMAVGMPEARILLAEAAVVVATSPKSNSSYLAINRALSDVANKRTGDVPMYLRNAPVKAMEELGYSVGYQYAHDFPEHYVPMQFLPDEMVGTKYYEPGNLGYEVQVKKWMEHLKNRNTDESNK
ncbi:MAG: replication-associated recombination protein A [Clostridiales bacterium]|nr:replication-associated recombination protein A [Candidatus Scatonaster coprocaballi]